MVGNIAGDDLGACACQVHTADSSYAGGSLIALP